MVHANGRCAERQVCRAASAGRQKAETHSPLHVLS